MPNLDGNPATPNPGDNILGASFIVDGSGVGEDQLANRRILTAGANVTLTDNGPGGTLVIAATGGSAYATVENNGTPVTQRTTLNLSTELAATDTGGKTALALATAGVPLAKLANLAGASILGRSATSSGVMAAITGVTVGHVLAVQPGGALAFSAPSGGGGGYATIERPNGTPLTQRAIMSFTTEFAATDNVDTTDIALATAGVTFAKMADLTAVSVLGRAGGTDGVMAAIQAAGSNDVLRRSGGGGLGFGSLTNLHLSGFSDTQVILGTAGGTIAGSAALVYDASRRFTSTGATIGLRQTGATSTDSYVQVEDFGMRVKDETLDLVDFYMEGSATTGRIRYEARAGSYVTGAAEFLFAPNSGSATLIVGRSDKGIVTGQATNLTLGSVGFAMITGGGFGVLGIGNAFTIPGSNPAGGFVIYSDAGAGKARGSSGTVTTFAPAEPHCPVCGTDFMTEHENRSYGYLSICLRCLSDELGARPWIRRVRPDRTGGVSP